MTFEFFLTIQNSTYSSFFWDKQIKIVHIHIYAIHTTNYTQIQHNPEILGTILNLEWAIGNIRDDLQTKMAYQVGN